MKRWVSSCPCQICVESVRRDEIRRTWRCLLFCLAMVGAAYFASNALAAFLAS